MNHKNFIISLFAPVILFCFLVILPAESNAQTRRKITKKSAVKNKRAVKKSPVKKGNQSTPPAELVEAIVIGNSNPVLTNPHTASVSKPAARIPELVSMGIINGKAQSLIKPDYPAAAKAGRASGQVNVQVTVDEAGKVISAQAVSGHMLLRSVAEQAARKSKFEQTRFSGQPVKVKGIIVYNFVAQ